MKNNTGSWLRMGITGIVLLALVIWYSVGRNAGTETVKLGQPVLDGQETGGSETGAEKAGSGRSAEAEAAGAGAGAENSGGGISAEAAGAGSGAGAENPGVRTGAGAENPGAKISAGAGETAMAEEAGRIFIHVCGEVVSPGVYELAEGSRLYQAVEAAGGLTGEADGDFLNMAQTLADGMQLRVPDRAEAEGLRAAGHSGDIGNAGNGGNNGSAGGRPDGPQAAGSQAAAAHRVNLNTATKEELMTLTGIGEARAEAILAYRQEAGGFQTIEDIMKVSGIKEAAFQKIKEDITV